MQDCLAILNIEKETVFKGAFTNIWSGGMTNIETQINIISNPKRHPINFDWGGWGGGGGVGGGGGSD